MHLICLDDAGSAGNLSEQYLVLSGVSVFEAQSYWMTQQLDKLAESIDPSDPHSVEQRWSGGTGSLPESLPAATL